jgi:hypothetical protein
METAPQSAKSTRAIPGLLAGLAAFDLLINLPRLSLSAPVSSLLVPSIDLLVVAAALVGIAQASPGARKGLRIALGVLLALLLAYVAGARFGFDAALGLFGGHSSILEAASVVACLVAAAAAAWIAYLLSCPVLRGFSTLVSRSVFLLVVALCAVIQVLAGRHVFSPSALPGLVRSLASLLK